MILIAIVPAVAVFPPRARDLAGRGETSPCSSANANNDCTITSNPDDIEVRNFRKSIPTITPPRSTVGDGRNGMARPSGVA